MPEEKQAQTNSSTSGAGIIQQGYETALQKTAGIINDFNFSNDKNRPQIVSSFKDNLLSLDRAVVKAIFDGTVAIRNKPDETFTIQTLPGVAIPKKLIQELKITPKKFFEEYDVFNRTKNEIINQAKATSLAEGAETKLTAAKQAVFGKGFGQIGTALGGMVSLKTAGRPAPQKQATPEEVKPAKDQPIEKITDRKDKKTKKPASKTTEEQDLDILQEELEEIKKKQAQKTPTKVRAVADVALYQKNFKEVLDNLEKDPDPFENNGAAFFGIRKLKQEVRQASKKDPQPELQNIYDRLDELGSEYRTAQSEHIAGKNGKARLLAAVQDVRAMSGLAQTATATPVSIQVDTTEIDQAWTTLTEQPVPGKQKAETVFKTAPLSPPPAPPTTDQQAVPVTKDPKAFASSSTVIKERLEQISNREAQINQRLTKFKQPAQATAGPQETAQEINLLEQELKRLMPQKQALNVLQQTLNSQTGTTAPEPEIIQKELTKLSSQESQINNRLAKIDLEQKTLQTIGRQQPGYQVAVQQSQALEQEKIGLISQTKNLKPQKQALENLLRDVEKLGQATIGAGLAGMAGAALMGTGAPSFTAVSTDRETTTDIKTGLKSQTTVQASEAGLSAEPTGPVPKPPVQVQAQAEIQNQISPPVASPPAPISQRHVQQARTQAPSERRSTGQASVAGSYERRSKLESYGTRAGAGQAALSTASTALAQMPDGTEGTRISISEPEQKKQVQTYQAQGEQILSGVEEEQIPARQSAVSASTIRTPSAPTDSKPQGTALISRQIKRRPKTARPGKKTALRKAGGYQTIGPQEIKPPIGRGLDLGRAMNLAAGQAMAGRQTDTTRAPEGLNLSTGGLETALKEGGFTTSAIPTQDEFLFDPLRAYNRPSVYTQRPPGAAYNTTETEDEYSGTGGEMPSDLERLSSLESDKQKARALTGQLLGPEAGIGLEAKTPEPTTLSSKTQEPEPADQKAPGRQEIPRLMRLDASRGSKIQKLTQARQKITELKGQFGSAKKAVQQFRDLKNVGELLSGISGWTLLALWLEWNLDIINKRIANSAIPFLEKAPSPDAPLWEKGKHAVKDGVTIFANILIPISALSSFIIPLIITAIIALSALGTVSAFLTVANFFGISIL